ncbi:hypothetical protein [Kitasatospora sp. NPDC058478]|uniref:hypothetical protein n=1 Tax=unclassified Kitasatospora TaxID=2633591 RepID=UPI0036516550
MTGQKTGQTTDQTADQTTDRPAEKPHGLQAIWANTLEPVAPLPWYRRLSLKAVVAATLAVGLLAALVVAAVTGAGAPPRHRIALPDRIGDQVHLPDDGSVQTARSSYQQRIRALSPYRELTVGGYGTTGSSKTTLLLVGLTGSFAEPQRELNKYFGRLAASDVFNDTVTERQDYPTGPLGGAFECAVLTYPSTSETTCVWADGSTVGIVVDSTGESSPQELADRARDIRAAVEVPAED